jgi:hypothetical protein
MVTVPSLLRVSRLAAGLLLPLLCSGCATIAQPARYVHMPEYGVVPVLDRRHYSEALVQYVAYDFTLPAGGGEIIVTPRSIPQSEAEARALAERNRAVLVRSERTKNRQELGRAPLELPAALIYWLPGVAIVTETLAHRAEESREAAATGSREPAPELRNVELRVVDESAAPLPGVTVLPLVSPIPFESWAGEEGRRSFGAGHWEPFFLSPELAEGLAAGLVRRLPDASLPALRSLGVTDGEGRWSHQHPEPWAREGEGDAVLYYLLAKEGFRPRVVTLPGEGMEPVERQVELGRETSAAEPGDLWDLVERLHAQLRFYRAQHGTRYARIPLPEPPLTGSEVDALLEEAGRIAPDYPPLLSARFYRAAERGDKETARTHGRFVGDREYLHALYGLKLSYGLVKY